MEINEKTREMDEENDEERSSTPCYEEDITNSEYGTPVKEAKEPCTIENSLYSRNAEMERLETQNAEYREKLLRTIRERDLNEELLKNVQGQHKKELEASSRRIKELEVQMKTNSDRAMAQEAHFNVTSREMTQKYNTAIQQATKRAEQSDKEKNEAVVKYAMREGEMMKLREEIRTKDGHLKSVKEELEVTKKAQSQETIDGLEKSINNLKVEAEKLKHERFEFENRMKIAEKRVETLTAGMAEAKQQGEVLRKQLIQAKDDKHHQEKLATGTADLERRLRESESDVEKLRTSQLDMATKFEEASRENSDLLSKIDILQDQLSLEEDRRKLCEEQIERLKGVESFVESSSHQIEETQKERETAEKERVQAEREAEECREQAEKMLQLTQQLNDRNVSLQRELLDEQTKNTSLTSKLDELTLELTKSYEISKTFEEKNEKLLEEVDELKKNISEKPMTLETLEEDFYQKKYEETVKRLEEMENKWTEEKNNFSAYKKKTSASMKELRSELATYRKSNSSGDNGNNVLAPPTSSDPSMSSRSRASSITSIDRVTSTSREEENEKEEQQKNMQQIMIDKIVILQRKLARRTEKCEFLEEHVRQCLEELQKKTKIIQHFALREEASLLMPSEGSIDNLFATSEFVQVPIVRKSSAYALMGAMFTASGGEKKQSQILTEVNSRLQAVLEDVIQKNICMRSTVDTLSSENTRLSRENRLLSLSSKCSQEPS